MVFLPTRKPTLSRSPGVAKSSGVVMMNDKLKGGNYSLITNPVKTRSGDIIDSADTQPISYSKTMKQTAERITKTGNPVEKAAANYYLFMDDPTKRGSAKYYENMLKRLGLDINTKSETGNPIGDFALDVVKGFVGSPAYTARTLASGGMGATLLSRSKKSERGDIVKGGAINAGKATIDTIVETPGQFLGGMLAGAAGSKGIGLISKGSKTGKTATKTTVKTSKNKQTKPHLNTKVIDAEVKKDKTISHKRSGFLDTDSIINLSLPSSKQSLRKTEGKKSVKVIASRNTPKLTEGKLGGVNTQLVPITQNTLKFTRKTQKKSGSRSTEKRASKVERKQASKPKQQNTQTPRFRRKSQTAAYKNEVEMFIKTLSDEDKYFLNNRAQMKIVDTPSSAKKALTIRRRSLKNTEVAEKIGAKKGQTSVSILKSNRESHKKFVANLPDTDLKYLQSRARIGIVDGTIKDAEAALKKRHDALRKHEAALEMDAKKGRASVSILKSNRESHKKFVSKLSKADLEYLQNRAKSGVIDGTIKDAEAALKKRHDALRKHEAAKSQSNALILPSQLRIIKEPTHSQRKTRTAKSYVEVDAGNGMKYLMRVDSEVKPKSKQRATQKPGSTSRQASRSKQISRTKRGSSRTQRVTALNSGSTSSTNTRLSTKQKQTTALSRQQKTEVESVLSFERSSRTIPNIALTIAPALTHSQKRKSTVSTKPAQSGKLIHSTEQKPQTKPKTDTESKKDSEQKGKQKQTQKRSSKQRLKKASLSQQRIRQASRSKQIAKSTPKTKTKKKARSRLTEEEKKKQRKKLKVLKKDAYRFETVNRFGWIKDNKPAAKPRKI